ncbi:MAG TPA: hypothetical protein DCS97_10560 [Planctomycetes bacterium]|nr:hypothetical protein [Planctomycetota bacterium]
MRLLLLLLIGCLLGAGEGVPTEFTFVETIAGRPVSGIDPEVVAALTASHKQRLVQARAELSSATPLLARQIRADIGAYDAEIARLAVAVGGTIEIGRRTYTVGPERIIVLTEGVRLEVTLASGAALAFSSQDADGAPVALARPPTPLPLAEGKPGPAMFGLPTLVFAFAADGRDYLATVAPGLANPFAHLVPLEGEDARVMGELGRMPGMLLDLRFTVGEAERRLTCVDIR